MIQCGLSNFTCASLEELLAINDDAKRETASFQPSNKLETTFGSSHFSTFTKSVTGKTRSN